MNITSGNKTELKLALAMYGPVTVLINTRPKTFKFYSSGVYFDGSCGTYCHYFKLSQSNNIWIFHYPQRRNLLHV